MRCVGGASRGNLPARGRRCGQELPMELQQRVPALMLKAAQPQTLQGVCPWQQVSEHRSCSLQPPGGP